MYVIVYNTCIYKCIYIYYICIYIYGKSMDEFRCTHVKDCRGITSENTSKGIKHI